MKARLLHTADARTYVLVFEAGDEVMAGLRSFAREHDIDAAQLTAIGAFSDVTLGYFERERRDYRKQRFDEQLEVLTLVGHITVGDGRPNVHAHIVLGRPDYTTLGGHLIDGHIRPTLEVILVESPSQLRRSFDPESGLALIAPDE